MRTDRPGSGPLGGPGSLRWLNSVQRSFYKGWKSIHGLKYQTVDNALGFTMDVYGQVPLRGDDMSLFRDSKINDRMETWDSGVYLVTRRTDIIPELIHMELILTGTNVVWFQDRNLYFG